MNASDIMTSPCVRGMNAAQAAQAKAFPPVDPPADTALATLARVAATRFRIEQLFEEAKDDVGLDHYEVRTWPAWHRHITLAMMALAWLASVRLGLEQTDPTVGVPLGKAGRPTSRGRSPAGRSRKPAA